jgi:hypothetical protein
MKKLRLTKARQECFLQALAETGSVIHAVRVAGTSRTRVYELRTKDPAFAAAWAEAEDISVDRLEDEARRRAVEGVPEPLVSAGKLVRDDNGQPITIRRYSNTLLIALQKAHRARRERSKPFTLLLQSAADAPKAIASIAAAAAEGRITPVEAGERMRFVAIYLKALDAQHALQKTEGVISIDDLNADRERNFALIDQIFDRLAERKVAEPEVAEPELADDSPNGGGGSTD